METAHKVGQFMKNVLRGHEKTGIPTLPHHPSPLTNTEPKRKPILKVHDLSTLGPPWMQSTCLHLP